MFILDIFSEMCDNSSVTIETEVKCFEKTNCSNAGRNARDYPLCLW